MECKLTPSDGIKKLSGWLKKISGEDAASRKTHKVITGVSMFEDNAKLLAASGNGTVCLRLESVKAFDLDLIATNAFLRLSVGSQGAKLYCIYRGRFILLKEQVDLASGLSRSPECIYWVSFEAHRRTILFGKGEPIYQNQLLSFTLPPSNKSPEQFWMNKIAHYRINTPAVIYSSKNNVQKPSTNEASINLLSTRM